MTPREKEIAGLGRAELVRIILAADAEVPALRTCIDDRDRRIAHLEKHGEALITALDSWAESNGYADQRATLPFTVAAARNDMSDALNASHLVTEPPAG